jgi:hypothetical protein
MRKFWEQLGLTGDVLTLRSAKVNLFAIIVLAGAAMELYVMSFGRDDTLFYILPLIWFAGGLVAGFAVMWYSFKATHQKPSLPPIHHVFIYFIFFSCAILIMAYLTSLFYNFPPDATKSDVVPTLQIMAKRLMNFQYPYYKVEFSGWSFEPGYLTMQYLPFVKAEILKVDYRTWAYMIFLGVLFLYNYRLNFNNDIYSRSWNLVLVILPFISIKAIMTYDASIFMHSVELLDVAYYMLLVYSLFSKSVLLRAFAITCCLLSRYGIVIWLPAYLFIYYNEVGLKVTLRLSLMVIVMVLVLYVLPFMTKEPGLFFKSLSNYNQMAVGQWSHVPDWYAHIGKPYILTQGLGFAIYFREFLAGEMLEKINTLKLVHLLSSFGVMVLTLVVYHFKRSSIKSADLYLAGSLVVFMTVFYNFVFAPFSYLFLVPYFTIIAVLYKMPGIRYDR